MMMAEQADDYQSLMQAVHLASVFLSEHEGDDVGRIKQLMGAMGQSFTTTMFAYQQAITVKDGIHFISVLAEKYGAEDWLGIVAGEQFRRPINTLRTRYAMLDAAALHERAGKVAPGLRGPEIVALSRALIVYYAFLLRRIGELLPVYELATVFEGQKLMAERVKASPMGKGVEG
jgi:hypothetical protein